ncbi:Fatty acid oxidation complex subunit alpha [Nymphon striatum]|nr:Fatty acid oxidation complex subunit alpha [Nymphon striatum]
MFPFGKPYSPPSDKLIHQVAQLALRPSSTRDRLTEGCYLTDDPNDPAVAAMEADSMEEIEAIYDDSGKMFNVDDGVRPDSSVEKIAKLKPFFDRPYGKVTPANSSQITDDELVWLTLDVKDEAANVINPDVVEELSAACDEVKTMSGIKGMIIHSGKTSGFIAGADVKKFTEVTDTTQALAKSMGLTDMCVPLRQLKASSIQTALRKPPKQQAPKSSMLLEAGPMRKLVAMQMRKQVASKAKQEHYPAPYALINIWEMHGSKSDEMYTAEAEV